MSSTTLATALPRQFEKACSTSLLSVVQVQAIASTNGDAIFEGVPGHVQQLDVKVVRARVSKGWVVSAAGDEVTADLQATRVQERLQNKSYR